MQEKIYVISDIEMGRGDITDDFSDDQHVADFLEQIKASHPDEKVTLVLNGDIFDFIKMAYKDEYPRYITEEISLWKLEQTFQKHSIVFDAFRRFLEYPRHSIHFVIGNHDPDLIWPKLQDRLKKELQNEDRVHIDYSFQTDDIHAEHGHRDDPFYANPNAKPIITYKGQQILNLPIGSQLCFSELVQLKRKFPEEERLYPKHVAVKKYPAFRKGINHTKRRIILKRLLLDPILHWGDPTYRVPYKQLFQHVFRHGMEVLDDAKLLHSWVDQCIKTHQDKKLFIFGHAHVPLEMEKHNKQVIITDTWRNEIDLTKNGAKKTKSYAEITRQNGTLVSAHLKQWP